MRKPLRFLKRIFRGRQPAIKTPKTCGGAVFAYRQAWTWPLFVTLLVLLVLIVFQKLRPWIILYRRNRRKASKQLVKDSVGSPSDRTDNTSFWDWPSNLHNYSQFIAEEWEVLCQELVPSLDEEIDRDEQSANTATRKIQKVEQLMAEMLSRWQSIDHNATDKVGEPFRFSKTISRAYCVFPTVLLTHSDGEETLAQRRALDYLRDSSFVKMRLQTCGVLQGCYLCLSDLQKVPQCLEAYSVLVDVAIIVGGSPNGKPDAVPLDYARALIWIAQAIGGLHSLNRPCDIAGSCSSDNERALAWTCLERALEELDNIWSARKKRLSWTLERMALLLDQEGVSGFKDALAADSSSVSTLSKRMRLYQEALYFLPSRLSRPGLHVHFERTNRQISELFLVRQGRQLAHEALLSFGIPPL